MRKKRKSEKKRKTDKQTEDRGSWKKLKEEAVAANSFYFLQMK